MKYEPLAVYLANSSDAVLLLTFQQIAEILGEDLPESGRRYPQFWHNVPVALPLAKVGWLAKPHLGQGTVEFVRASSVGPIVRDKTASAQPMKPILVAPDFVLVGCVKTKLEGIHQARQLYQSDLFVKRRRHAETQKVPWFILSALYGLVAPDDQIASYDLALTSMTRQERREWSKRVLKQVDETLGDITGKTIEVHAGAEYRDDGLRQGLEARGARVEVPLEHVPFRGQLAWYGRTPVSSPPQTSVVPTGTTAFSEIARALTTEFLTGQLRLQDRPGAPRSGWEAMPECVVVEQLRSLGATAPEIRLFLTLVSAMDRSRDAQRLWDASVALFREQKWAFNGAEVAGRSLHELRDTLATYGVSQRHGTDTAGWRLILESINDPLSPAAIRRAIFEGQGDAIELLRDLRVQRNSGQPWYPLLSGPKVSMMWIRMLASPGGTAITNIDALTVAVDAQVRKVTENLGLTQTRGQELEKVRNQIADVWRNLAPAVAGPADLAGTSAAADPALWFFGKWGCTFCERKRKKLPISTVCEHCNLVTS